jgi:hypothetical protein
MDRDTIAAAAEDLAGVSYGATRERYIATLYPHDTHADALSMGASQSSCGLVCEALLRTQGVDCPLPYASSFRTRARLPAVSWQREEARKRGAWVDALTWSADRQLPILGDMVEIGGALPPFADPGLYYGPHVLTIVGGDRFDCVSIDGGQSDAQNKGRVTAIARRERTFDERGKQLWLVDPATRKGRRVTGWIDVGLLGIGAGA